MNTLRVESMTDTDLLMALCGPEGQNLSRKPLSELFGFEKSYDDTLGVKEDRAPYLVHRQIAVAKELYARAMVDDMKTSGVEISSPSIVKSYLCNRMSGLEHEVFWCLFLDSRSRLISAQELFRGTLTQTSVYPREVVKAALSQNAYAVIFAHNHPSGIASPSGADEHLTTKLQDALKLVDIRVLDHIIVAGNDTLSMSEKGLL
jgi:DNA repair protein RadC